ncbi:hypothetical protein BOTBODRAFT_172436 [Botryobasidium botryosum FD-172 SS1]|uniref:Peptidase M48 domain-containing protein n=1 Tax=Botryobasidium botryosum (strain FD-172 SS1) TaxID=930990 RepID=A0A067MPC6_BOTB1|nr:hypothetical protein BOTBODRAFT_172436 [Botryobasidium botryosum FD-172 SS1]
MLRRVFIASTRVRASTSARSPSQVFPQRPLMVPPRRLYQTGPQYTRFSNTSSSFIDYKKWDRPMKIVVIGVGLGGAYYLFHLEKVEQTGRWRFMDTSPAQERQLGDASFNETMGQYRQHILPANHPLTVHVKRVAERILTASNLGSLKDPVPKSNLPPSTFGDEWGADGDRLAEQEWEVFVIQDDKLKNAFAGRSSSLPGSCQYVGMKTALLQFWVTVVARHSAEKISGYKILIFMSFLLEILGLDFGFSRLGLTLLMTLPNSRALETEADNIGLRLMSKACYDPREASKMWVRMTESEPTGKGLFGGGTDFISTHPANEKRIKKIEQWLPEALAIRAASPACSHALEGFVDAFYDRNHRGAFSRFSGTS